PMNRKPDAALALSAIGVPGATAAEHVDVQLRPLPVTVPWPVTVTATCTIGGGGVALKDARTTTSALICAVQAAAPPQAPPQPAKLNPESGMAVSCTAVPSSKAAVQLLPQSMPPG